jgi:hypothetical protein
MNKAITFTDYAQAREYANEVYAQGFLPDISNPQQGVYVVKILGEKRAATRELHGLGKIEEKEPTTIAERLGFKTGRAIAKAPVATAQATTGVVTSVAGHITPKRRMFMRHIPSTKGKHPHIDLDMPYLLAHQSKIEPVPGSIGKGFGHKGAGEIEFGYKGIKEE